MLYCGSRSEISKHKVAQVSSTYEDPPPILMIQHKPLLFPTQQNHLSSSIEPFAAKACKFSCNYALTFLYYAHLIWVTQFSLKSSGTVAISYQVSLLLTMSFRWCHKYAYSSSRHILTWYIIFLIHLLMLTQERTLHRDNIRSSMANITNPITLLFIYCLLVYLDVFIFSHGF
jgi:hypothetical protein